MRFSPQLRALDWLVARPIAHRGLHGGACVENTASAFAAAIAGTYAIECDVQVTQDGLAAVFHDETLDRLTGRSGWVRDLTMAELRKIPFHIQSLPELLDQVAGRVPLVIEIKSHWDGDARLVDRVAADIASYGGPLCVMSFDPDVIEAVRHRAPDVVRGIVADRTVDPYYNTLPLRRRYELRTLSHIPRTQPHFLSYAFNELPFAPVGRIRELGHPVIGWTIRSEVEATRARRYIDQITFEGFLPR
jgi:glycerophosphoryl diester phosphodiesterase